MKITEESTLVNLFKDGTLVYFTQDDSFVFAKKFGDSTNKLKEKILELKKGVGNHPVKFFPISVRVGLVRDQISQENIKQYYQGDYMSLNMTREDFIFRHLEGAPFDIKHNKTKGTMQTEDIGIKSWLTYRGTGKNLSIFNI